MNELNPDKSVIFNLKLPNLYLLNPGFQVYVFKDTLELSIIFSKNVLSSASIKSILTVFIFPL